MTSQEEWREKNYQEHLGKSGNNSIGTQANKQGYKQYQQQQQQQQQQQRNSGNNGGCFPAGTAIATPSGNKDIASLSKGDWVHGIDIKTGKISARQILKRSHYVNHTLWQISFEQGSTLRTTRLHSFYASKRWQKAASIQPGEIISTINLNGEAEQKIVTESRCSDKEENVYNIVVDCDFTFIADGAVVHSFTYLRHTRIFMWRLFSVFATQLRAIKPRALVD